MGPTSSWLLSMGLLSVACSRAGTVESTRPTPSVETPRAPVAAPEPAHSGLPGDVPSSPLLPVGADVPDVAATAQNGKVVRLRALKGKPLIIYFYPKDDTPGCTVEAKGIRDQYAELNARAVVLGVSADSLESHQAFAAKYDLPFSLLDDSNHALSTAFGVPLSSGHTKRVTFVIDAAGKVRKVFPNVNPDGHASELIEALKSLG